MPDLQIRMGLRMAPVFDQKVRAMAKAQLMEKVWERALVKSNIIVDAIGEYLFSVFEDTPVILALRGGHKNEEDDLQAHLGLNDEHANTLADGMAGIIRESVRLQKGKPGILVGVRAVPRDWKPFLELPYASYISNNKYLIPVMHWMLIDPHVDIATAMYEIVFASDEPENAGVVKHSRSGRAIMRLPPMKMMYNSGGYALPPILRQIGGQNFIEYTLGRPGVAERCMKILLENL